MPAPVPSSDGGGDAAVGRDAAIGDAAVESGTTGDAATDGAGPPVGPPGRPGFALTGGGTTSASAHYKLTGAIGESPGGNLTSASTHYKLYSGVIGATH
jgi:hypothetical protein